VNYLPGLPLNRDLPNLCLLSSSDDSREPPAPGGFVYLYIYWMSGTSLSSSHTLATVIFTIISELPLVLVLVGFLFFILVELGFELSGELLLLPSLYR
jgi:hypothetical protein